VDKIEGFAAKGLLAAFIGSVLTIHAVFWVLAALIAIDFASGLLVGWVTKTLSARVCSVGIAKKTMMLLLVIAAAIAGLNFSHLTAGTIPDSPLLGQLVAAFYGVNEFISIIENAALIGIPVPRRLVDVLEKLRATAPDRTL
jgi:toxin secretion/phage lysis holin